jgi:hypothetical protein
MERIQYEGYVIEERTVQLRDTGRWTLAINLWRDSGDETVVRQFSSATTFATRDEAVRHCINFGRQIIGGKIKGCTAP